MVMMSLFFTKDVNDIYNPHCHVCHVHVRRHKSVIIIKPIIQNSVDVKCINVKLQTHCACIIGCWCAFSCLVTKEN